MPSAESPFPSSPAVASGIDPADLETTLRVLVQMTEVDPAHPDYVTVRRATAQMF